MASTAPLQDEAINEALVDAKRAADEGRNEDALAALEKLAEDVPNDGRVLGNLAAFRIQQQMFEPGLKTLRQWERVEPDNPLLHYHMGVAFTGVGDAWQAVEAYRRALELRPDLGEAAFEIARLLKSGPRSREAFDACVSTGHLLYEARRFDDAVVLYNEALSIDGSDADLSYRVGNAYLEKGDLTEARKAFEHTLEKGDDDARAKAHNALAVVAMRDGRLDAAETHLAKALDGQAVFPQAYNNRGNLAARRGQHEAAIESYEFATRQFPGYKDAWFNLGLEHERLAHYDDALAALDQVVRLDERHRQGHFARARLLLKLGRYREGWAGYLWRWAALGAGQGYAPDPRYQGRMLPLPKRLDFRHLKGKRVVLMPEPVQADEVSFLRFVPQLAAKADEVRIMATEPVGRMLSECANVTMFDGQFAERDLVLPSGELPYVLGLDDEADIPGPLPLASRSMMGPQAAAQQLSAAGPGPYLAVTWRTAAIAARPDPEALARELVAEWVGAWPGTAIAVQADATADECAAIAALAGKPLHHFGAQAALPSRFVPLLQQVGAFAGVSGVAAHLAGGVGVPTHLLVRPADEWCLGTGASTPWYPEFALYRGDGDRRVVDAAADLARVLADGV